MILTDGFRKSPGDVIVALIGNPNVGKSSLFNALTGMRQHTGNWPGKTVEVACGRYVYKGKRYILVDLPGTYSLDSHSEDERIAVDFLKSGQADCVLVVGDATALERNLYLLLQTLAISKKAVFCVNLIDEANRKGIHLRLPVLEKELGMPVVGTSAASGQGLDALKETLRNCAEGFCISNPIQVPENQMYEMAGKISQMAADGSPRHDTEPADTFVLGKLSGYFILLALLFGIFWLTINGANYLSDILTKLFHAMSLWLRTFSQTLPNWLSGLLLDGVYQTVTSVISVMLPPMIIFYPLFSFLEDLGYLPRAAFLMDHRFQTCGGCGKQALTMAMGYGCNTVGVMGCRIISSPKERLIAILTNSLTPCNGRFPTIIALITIFFTDHAVVGAFILLCFILISVGMTFLSSWILHKSIASNEKSHFVLELPPYRRPNLKKIMVRACLDRTLYILGRAVMISLPAGVLIWILQNIQIGELPLIYHLSTLLDPVGVFLGMNGAFLVGFILSFPANELLLPITVSILQGGQLASVNMANSAEILLQNGITWRSAICIILFTMFHWPCGMTCLTIHRETKSAKWTVVSILLPLIIGIFSCMSASILLKMMQ